MHLAQNNVGVIPVLDPAHADSMGFELALDVGFERVAPSNDRAVGRGRRKFIRTERHAVHELGASVPCTRIRAGVSVCCLQRGGLGGEVRFGEVAEVGDERVTTDRACDWSGEQGHVSGDVVSGLDGVVGGVEPLLGQSEVCP